MIARRLRATAGVGAGLLLLAVAGCGATPAAAPATHAAPTVNRFLTAFFAGRMATAASLTTQGASARARLAAELQKAEALLVIRPPFNPVTDLHWTTTCGATRCEVTFSSFNALTVAPMAVAVQTVHNQPRVPVSAIARWLTAQGHVPQT